MLIGKYESNHTALGLSLSRADETIGCLEAINAVLESEIEATSAREGGDGDKIRRAEENR